MYIYHLYGTLCINVQWLTDEFIPYLKQWEMSVQKRPGAFTPQAKGMMLLAKETRHGIEITGTVY